MQLENPHSSMAGWLSATDLPKDSLHRENMRLRGKSRKRLCKFLKDVIKEKFCKEPWAPAVDVNVGSLAQLGPLVGFHELVHPANPIAACGVPVSVLHTGDPELN